MLFSIFPFLIFLTALAGFFGNDDLAAGIVTFLLGVAPAELVKPLVPEIRSILTVPRTGLLSIAAVLTIWSAMGGVDSVRVGLNRAYDLKEHPWLSCNLVHLSAIGHPLRDRLAGASVLPSRLRWRCCRWPPLAGLPRPIW